MPSQSSFQSSPSKLSEVVRRGKVLLGVVHLPPLVGSPQSRAASTEEVVRHARQDAEAILEAGFDGYIIENFGDVPFFPDRVPPHVLTLMTRVALELPRGDSGALVGVNVLRNDARGALAVAFAAGLDFFRVNVHSGAAVTDQGLIQGRAAETLRDRDALAPQVAVLADVDVKHAAPLVANFDLANAAKETAYRALADGLIVTGGATGQETSLADLKTVVEAVPDRPVFVGSGVDKHNVEQVLQYASGVIVGTSLKQGGRVEGVVDPQRAREFIHAARRA